MAENQTIAYITPDYLEVRPLGFNPEAGAGSGEGDEGGGTNTPVPFNPFDHISELERIIEEPKREPSIIKICATSCAERSRPLKN